MTNQLHRICVLVACLGLASRGDQTPPPVPPVPSKSLPGATAGPSRIETSPSPASSAGINGHVVNKPVTAALPSPGPETEAAGTDASRKPVATAATLANTTERSEPNTDVSGPRGSGKSEVELLFTYGSEKQKWIEDVTRAFNASGRTLKSGERVRVVPIPVGSGELIDELLTQRRKAHLISPAASAFILRGNAESREKGQGDLVGPTTDLVSSPVVVAIWREMAEAIGWPGKNPRWRDVFEYARDDSQWRRVAKPEWGSFKLGHTHPESSNSGLHALLLLAYSATDRFENFTRLDAGRPEVPPFIRGVEKSVPYYDTSTGFLARRMIREGPSALSAAIVYENLVLEANREALRKDPAVKLPRVVAIYPAEGTFPSEHPVGIVERPWVSEKHRAAGKLYVDYLLERPQQEKALRYGFRPSSRSADIDLKDVLKPEYGVNDKQPAKTLRPPPAAAIRRLQEIWRVERNPNARTVADQ